MKMKAQIEIIAILGIVVVLAVVALYAVTTGTTTTRSNAPANIGQEQNLIKDAIASQGMDGASFAIKWMEQQGGYMSPDYNNSVAFTNVAVPYWQKCGDKSAVPTMARVTKRLEDTVREYLTASISLSRLGSNVTLDMSKLSVSANILSDKIDFSVNAPVNVKGYPIQTPITFSMPTKFGRIFEFGRNFAEQNSKDRFLENYVISTMYFSGELETTGMLTQCGEGLYLSSRTINTGLMHAIGYTLANTIWWEPMPVATTTSKTYAVESVNGKKYTDLSPGFYLPSGFSLSPSRPLSITNNMHVASMPTFDVPVCLALYNWRYSTSFPVVLRVKDDLTGNNFNFALFAEIKDMTPGDCSGLQRDTLPQAAMRCTASIKVVDRSGNPVEGASALFGGLFVGESDRSGMIAGPAVCGSYIMDISKEGYELYTSENTTDINKTYVLRRMPVLGLNFSDVSIRDVSDSTAEPNGAQAALNYTVCSVSPTTKTVLMNLVSGNGNYLASNADTESSNSTDCSQSANCVACKSSSESGACRLCAIECSSGFSYLPFATVDYVPAGTYLINATLVDMTEGRARGGFITEGFGISESDARLNVYLPLNESLSSSVDGKLELADMLRSRCSMVPVTTGQQSSIINMSGCSCTQLKGMIEREFSSCINQSRLDSMFQSQRGTWDCSRYNVIAAVGACGFGVRGC